MLFYNIQDYNCYFLCEESTTKNLKSSKFVREMLRRLKEKVEVSPKEYHDFKILIFQQKYVP